MDGGSVVADDLSPHPLAVALPVSLSPLGLCPPLHWLGLVASRGRLVGVGSLWVVRFCSACMICVNCILFSSCDVLLSVLMSATVVWIC